VTPLRQRMLHELQRRNYSASTIRSYFGAAQQFAEHFHCSPEYLGPEHLRRYQIFLLWDKKLEPSTVEIRISALRFLYKRTLRRRDFTYDDLIFPKVPQKLPIVLSREEVVRLIGAAPNRLSAHWEKLDPVRFSEIARVLLVRSIVPMFKCPEAAASYAISFWIVERLRRRIVCQSRFAQVVVCIRDIHKIGPFRSQKIEAD
jgi:hypothetical protein